MRIIGNTRTIMNNLKKSQKGSITVFVLASMLFMLIVIMLSYVGISNKTNTQVRETKKIQEEYSVEKSLLDKEYKDTVERLDIGIYINLYKSSGKKYYVEEWTNEDLTMKVNYPDQSSTINVYIDGKQVLYDNKNGYKITKNCTIKAESNGKVAEIKVTKIDKEKPTIDLENAGGVFVLPTGGSNGRIKATISAQDSQSKLQSLEYGWSRSNTQEPESYESIEGIRGKAEIQKELKKDDSTQGEYYLWIKATDIAGNEQIGTSKVLQVLSRENSDKQLILTANPSAENWTNNDVTVIPTYGQNLIQNKTLTCTGKENTDYQKNGITNIIVKTNNQIVTATAEDTAGNKITTTLTVSNIDKKIPTVEFSPNGGTDYIILPGQTTADISVKLTANDEGGSNLDKLQYQITNSEIMPQDNDTNWKTFENGQTITEAKTGGTYYLYTKVIDGAGNRATSIQKSNAYIVSYQINYDANGGEGVPDAQIKTHGTDLTLSSIIPTKKDYKFEGWSKTNNSRTPEYQANGIYTTDEAVTLYAIWSKELTATFYSYNGTAQINTKVIGKIYNDEKSVEITSPTIKNITKDNTTYIPRGWSKQETPNAQIEIANGANVTISEDISYYCSYSSQITATFYYSNGTVQESKTSQATRYMSSNGDYIQNELSIPTEVISSKGAYGTKYIGIAKEANSTTAIEKPTTEQTVYYAFYNCTITYWYYNGSEHISTTATRRLTSNGTSYIGTVDNTPTPGAYDGVTFNKGNWSSSSTSIVKVNPATTDAINICAYYEKTITATFNYNTSSGASKIQANGIRVYISENSGVNIINGNITIPTEVTSSKGAYGTKYSGVAKDANSESGIVPTTAYTNYYAYYTVGVTYYYYDGSSHTSKTATRKYINNGTDYIISISEIPTPGAYDGVTFNKGNWSSSSTSIVKVNPSATDAINIYAYYEKTITATFNYYTSSGAAKAQASSIRKYISKNGGINTYNGNIAIPEVVKNSTGPGNTTYFGVSTQKTATSGITPTTENLIYYALYNKTVTINKYERYEDSNKIVVITGTAFGYYDGTTTNAKIDLGTSNLNGYTFRGWSTNTSANATIQVGPGGSVSIINDTNYYASYIYNITTTYNGNGGTTTTATSTGYLNYDDDRIGTAIVLPSTTRTGYSFQGWYTAASGGNKIGNAGASYTPIVDSTLYAHWVDDIAPTMGTLTLDKTGWTNSKVKITAKATDSGSGISHYTFSTNGNLTALSTGWKDITNTKSEITQTYDATSNGTYYFYVKDAAGNINKKSITISKIEKVKPTIGSFTGTTIVSGNLGTIKASGIADTGGSGLEGYYLSTSSTTPTKDSSWKSNTSSSLEIEGLKPTDNTTYYLWVKDKAGNISEAKSCTINVQTAVAKIGTTYYASIASAVSALSTSTITMLVNRTESVTIPSGKNITLDLNGKTITGTITNKGTLKTKNGTITSTSGIAIAVEDNGTLEVRGGSVIYSQANKNAIAIRDGTVTVYGGKIYATKGEHGVWVKKGKLYVKGGYIYTQSSDGSSEAIDIESKGVAEITGGQIRNDAGGKAIFNSGKLIINGANVDIRSNSSSATVNIDTGGTFSFSKGTIRNQKGSSGKCYYNNNNGDIKYGTWTK